MFKNSVQYDIIDKNMYIQNERVYYFMKSSKTVRIDMEDLFPLSVRDHIIRTFFVVLASVIMSVNIKSFVNAGGLFPGGFNGLTLLIQRSAEQFLGLALPFTLINFLLNAIPAVISYRFIGKRFTVYSCIMIILTSVLTDIIPPIVITNDILLICIFGGIINGFAIGLCRIGKATSGGTDFIAVALSERLNVDAWNYILLGNAAMLIVAGLLFGWERALYSIVFQFASTQVVHMLDTRYKRSTLLIVSDKYEQIYQMLRDTTHHSGTLFHGTGLYNDKQHTMIYTVISADQVKKTIKLTKEIDPKAFINVLKTERVTGNFYQQPND